MAPNIERVAPNNFAAIRARLDKRGGRGRPIGFETLFRIVSDASVEELKHCIEFPAHANRDGYVMLRFMGKQYLAHRVAYCCARGIEPPAIDGQVVRHSCDNPPCVNPGHLVLRTQTDNVRDMHERERYTPPPAGEASVRAKLTNDQVAFIRRSYGRRGVGGISAKDLAKRFSISRSCVDRILHNTARRQG